MQIQPLTPEHDAALRSFLAEFGSAGEESIPAFFAPHDMPIEDIIAGHAADEAGDCAPPKVPATTRFAIDDDGEILAVYNARHTLNDRLRVFGGHVGYSVRPSARGKGVATRMLRHAMEDLRARGATSLLITCDPTNVGSARVIEKCGGVLRDQVYSEEHGFEICRYWID